MTNDRRGSVSAADRAWNWINMSVPQRAGEERMLKALRIALNALEKSCCTHGDQRAIERMADALEARDAK